MHELAMCESIMEAVERRADGRRVGGITVRVGVLQRVWKPAFEQCFEMVAAGTLAEGASVDLVVLPVRSTCGSCGRAAESDDQPLACATCGSTDLDVTGGDELMLESMRVDREPAAPS
ncbi:MAG: hydrogenase maturation nickel metallochaperone HypA [Chloroflexi bacterium]|nr:hydrogenase maturation nickel metallochaperone HypA [Chloroflexota bacterium]